MEAIAEWAFKEAAIPGVRGVFATPTNGA